MATNQERGQKNGNVAPGLEEWRTGVQRLLEAMEEHAVEFMDQEELNLGHLEEQLRQDSNELLRGLMEAAAQRKADRVPFRCHRCGAELVRRRRTERKVQTRFGPIKVARVRGWCWECKDWSCPGDAALGLHCGQSPHVAELSALLAAKMPMEEAARVMERITGRPQSTATLARTARREGQRAVVRRDAADRHPAAPPPPVPLVAEAKAFTMVIEIDAMNIRERDHWGKTREMCAAGQPPERWHWVYLGTVFNLDARGRSAGGRPIILERGVVATRQGLDALRSQLYGEAVRRGLLQAERVVIIADGAAWIWNLAKDRFGNAVQRLDLFHGLNHLWDVANALHGAGTPEAKAWVERFKKPLEQGRPEDLVAQLQGLLAELTGADRDLVAKEVEYFRGQKDRMDYPDAKTRGEPCGSGAVESTCRQFQCRLKRPGQFWTIEGDEPILCLDTFWRNGRWSHLFPHVPDPSRN